MSTLAVRGGRAVGQFKVPEWPQARAETFDAVRTVLNSGRWALSGASQGVPSAEETFAKQFARFNEIQHCVPTANGTSALVIALEALDVGVGDEVIIPSLTWVANLFTVLSVNAKPVLVDIDPETLCMSPSAVQAAITPRTRAIVVVHLYSSIADLDVIMAIATRHGIAVIEDCAQAHGARWRGRRVGSWGAIATFSMQQTKLLTAGEGGAAICTSDALYERLYQLRCDGRTGQPNPAAGEMELTMRSTIAGANYCLSELSAAVLSEQLSVLEAQNLHRARVAATVDQLLSTVPGMHPIKAAPHVTARTFYYYTFRIDRDAFAGVKAGTVCRALTAETGIPFQPTYPPLHQHPLSRPQTKRRFDWAGPDVAGRGQGTGHLVEAERAHDEVVTFHHSVLLAEEVAFDHLPAAVEKLHGAPNQLQQAEYDTPDLINPM